MNFAIHLLTDGTSYWDGGGAFGLVPRTKWTKLIAPDDLNRVPQELRCVLVDSGGGKSPADRQLTLIDCGVGDKPNELREAQYEVRRPTGSLLDGLERLGISPDQINTVILTHLHGDHSGWATCIDTDGQTAPTFSNARYFVQRTEYADATHPNERTRNTYFEHNYVPLMEAGVLTLLDGEAQITQNIRVAPTPGHTAGHQSVVITPPEGAPYFVLGDLATYMIQFSRLPWVTAYDVLPLVTIESKRQWQAWAVETGATLISPHETIMPTGTLIRTDKGFLNVVSARPA